MPGSPSLLNTVVSTNADSIFPDPYFDVSGLRSFTIQVFGTFTGTIIFQVSNDPGNTPTNWTTLSQNISVPGVLSIQLGYRFLRIGATSFSAGSANIRVLFSTENIASSGSSGGGDASEATLQSIFGALDTVEPKLQSIIDKSPGIALLKKSVALTGSGVVIDPAAGKRLYIFNLKFSLSADMTDVAFKFASNPAFEKYLAPKTGGLYGSNLHPNYIQGAVDEVLNCDITGTGTVQINVEYLEV